MNYDELLKILACPACHSPLELAQKKDGDTGFACPACKKVYPIRNDIPIMLVEAAIPFPEWDKNGDMQCECS